MAIEQTTQHEASDKGMTVKTETAEKRTKKTWLYRYNAEKAEPDFDSKQFAGTITFEKVESAKQAIRRIAAPFLSKDAPDIVCGEKGLLKIEQELTAATERLIEEIKAGARSSVKVSGCIDLG